MYLLRRSRRLRGCFKIKLVSQRLSTGLIRIGPLCQEGKRAGVCGGGSGPCSKAVLGFSDSGPTLYLVQRKAKPVLYGPNMEKRHTGLD